MKTWAKMNKVPFPLAPDINEKQVYAIGLFSGKRACLFDRDYKLITTYATPIARKMISEAADAKFIDQQFSITKLAKESYPEGYPKVCDVLYIVKA